MLGCSVVTTGSERLAISRKAPKPQTRGMLGMLFCMACGAVETCLEGVCAWLGVRDLGEKGNDESPTADGTRD